MLLAVFVVLLILFVALPLVGFALWALISAAIVGVIIGGLARLILPGRQTVGILATVLLGWLGSLIGSIIGYRLLHTGWLPTVLIEIGVAALLIFAYSKRSATSLPGRNRVSQW